MAYNCWALQKRLVVFARPRNHRAENYSVFVPVVLAEISVRRKEAFAPFCGSEGNRAYAAS